MSGTLHLLIGPVGAGKTTWAARRAAGVRAVPLDLDAWMVRLYGADERPDQGVMGWYLERRERCRAQIWEVALDVLRCGVDVYLELGLVRRAERLALYAQADAEQVALRVILLDAPREVRRARVQRRNEAAGPTTQVVPMPFFELASDAWEPPDAAERAAREILDA